ncbi:MAG: family 20 glycosylhydrolase [Armatimonadota bacterium]
MRIAEIMPTPKEMDLSEEQTVLVDHDWHVRDESGLIDVGTKFAEAFCIGVNDEPNAVALQRDESMGGEAYALDIQPGRITVTAAHRPGYLHALATIDQLRDGPMLPAGTIRDRPQLPVRGLQLMVEKIAQLDEAQIISLIRSAARHKLNTLLIEFGDRFPFDGEYEVVASPSALTRPQLRRIIDEARDLGLEIIPLVQCMGHLEWLLQHDEFAGIREEDEVRAQLCPSNERSAQVWAELTEQVLDFIGDCDRLHIGGDETRQLGECPQCAARVAEAGTGRLYADHVNRVCEWLDDRGIAPIIWDDILCAHPGTMDHLHEAAQVMYWDYWTTQDPSPLLVARGSEAGAVVYDERWDGEWAGSLPEVTRKTLDRFAKPVRLDEDLGEEYLSVYRDCLGDGFPRYVRAFPYLEHYQGRGRTVYGAPTCSGNHSYWHTLPDIPRHGDNMKTFADRLIEAGAEGMVTSAWYNRSPELLHFGIVATAEFTW